MENNGQTAQNNKTWIPWVLGILLAIAITALAFTVFESEKPVVTYTDENGIITGTVKSPSVDVRFQTDQPKQLKEGYEKRLQEEKNRTENAENNLKEYQRNNVSTTGKLSGKIDEVVVELKGLRSDVEELKTGQEIMNNHIVAGFNTVNTNLTSIDKNVISVKKEVKKQGRLTREEIKNVFKSVPRSQVEDQTEDEEDTSDWPAGAKK